MAASSPTDMPNYRFGCSHVVLALYNKSNGNYGGIWYEPGIEGLDESMSDNTNSTSFHSDNGKEAKVNGPTTTEHTLSFTHAMLSAQYQTKVLGHYIDATTGAIVKGFDDVKAPFAIGFKIEGTKVGTKVWKFNCTSSEPIASYQSQGENTTESPQTGSITVEGDPVHGYEMVCLEGDPGYETFLDSVPAAPTKADSSTNGN